MEAVSLVPIDRHLCPDCGEELASTTTEQPALLRHGGYGATRQDRVRHCPSCGFRLHAEQNEVRP